MIGKNFEIRAEPRFDKVRCPKHGNDMVELENGWFGLCWYCKECKFPYELELRKMRKVNKENLKKVLTLSSSQ